MKWLLHQTGGPQLDLPTEKNTVLARATSNIYLITVTLLGGGGCLMDEEIWQFRDNCLTNDQLYLTYFWRLFNWFPRVLQ